MATSIIDDPKKKKGSQPAPTHVPSELEKKYGSYLANRESDANLINYAPDYGNPSGATFKDIFSSLAKQYSFSPQLLFANSTEEGLRDMIAKKSWSGNKDYPIPGAEYLGLDYFGQDAPNLVKTGLLPQDFSKNYTPYNYTLPKTEGGNTVPSADFKTFSDALTAQAGELASRRTAVDEQAKKLGVQLSPEARDFFTLVHYNASSKTMPQMMSDYSKAGYLDDNAFLKQRPTVGKNGVHLSSDSYTDVYDHAMRRFQPSQAWAQYFTTDPNSSTATGSAPVTTSTLPDKFNTTIDGKQREVIKEKSGRYTYVNDDGNITEYKTGSK